MHTEGGHPGISPPWAKFPPLSKFFPPLSFTKELNQHSWENLNYNAVMNLITTKKLDRVYLELNPTIILFKNF